MTRSRHGRAALSLLGRSGVPTTLVGRQVIRGGDVEAVRKALERGK